MRDTLTIRLDGELAREALWRQLAVVLFDQLRNRITPLAGAQGLLTDEDVFLLVS